MDKLELQERILKGENLHTEFKESLPDNEALSKSIVCFANADGGQLIIGIRDSGDIVGVGDLDEAIRKIDDVAFQRCEPPVSILTETVDIAGEVILIASVPKGEQRPYRTGSGLYYIRSGNRCRQASWQEVRRLYQTIVFWKKTSGLHSVCKDYSCLHSRGRYLYSPIRQKRFGGKNSGYA